MPDHTAFLASISANPDDDLPRLVYADWLEENGDSRATFVRLEVALRRAAPVERDDLQERLHRARRGLPSLWVAALDRPQAGWRIVRQPETGNPVFGRAIPAFIFNFSYHLSPVSVFADGAIDCWGYVDLPLFRRKLAERWVVPGAEVGGDLNIHNLGRARVEAAEWDYTPADFERLVADALREFNPPLDGLLDMGGTDIEVRDGIRYAKGSGWGRGAAYRATAAGQMMPGSELPVFEVTGEGLRLRRWLLYADGRSHLGYGGALLPTGAVEEMFADGRLTLTVAAGTWVTLDGLGRFRAGEGWWGVRPEERVREAADLVHQLNGEASAGKRCMAALRDYRTDPSVERREALRAAYDAVPEHLRMYCGAMDTKDGPIRRILSGVADDPDGD